MPGATDPAAEHLRAGGRALLLLADSVSVSILRSLEPGPMESSELIDRVENVSRSTCFERLRDLEGISLIVRERSGATPPVASCRLKGSGRCLLRVARLLEGWLGHAPAGPLGVCDARAAAATKALALGWGSTILRWLAERPRSLTELEPLVDGLGYRKLERAMRDLCSAGLVERVDGEGRLSPYAVTRWARESVAVLAAAVRWERQRIPDRSTPVTGLEVEAGFLLALPLLEVPEAPDGSCMLLVDPEDPQLEDPAGVAVRIHDGRAIRCVPASAVGSRDISLLRGALPAWLHAVIRRAPERLQGEGGARFAALIAGLHEVLLMAPGQLFEPA